MDYSVFAIELAFAYDAQSASRPELRRLILEHPEQTSYAQKAAFYTTLTNALLREAPAFERGCWDYFDDHSRAEKDFKMWLGGMTTEEGARKEPSGAEGRGPYRGAGETRYCTFTMAFLLVRGSNSDRTLASRCTIPQANLWRRDVFVYLLQGIRLFNFTSVRSDVVYMIPNRDDFGLTAEDLAAEKFKYLRPIG